MLDSSGRAFIRSLSMAMPASVPSFAFSTGWIAAFPIEEGTFFGIAGRTPAAAPFVLETFFEPTEEGAVVSGAFWGVGKDGKS